MADTLPIDADSAALAARLAAPEQRLLAGLVEHVASGWIPDAHLDDCDDDGCTGCDPQYLREVHLSACAAEAGMTPEAYTRQGLLAEWHHQIDDPAVPYSPYLTAGGAS
ncbi:hypothetical protein ACFWJT_15565 [Streptomyces sp. NPDC127069]|uniref:hypothetical protein n=1 Tax=Streptomyces sp. NPDC127069 TaxID=3347128 RepID=UPI0036507F2B